MEWQRGEWHTVTVERDPEFTDDLEFDVKHLPDCPTELIYEGTVLDYTCSMGWELSNNGFCSFDIAEPGTYRARVNFWPGGFMSDPDHEVEVEMVIA